jgi:two-component system chemotaxis response regulator CheB
MAARQASPTLARGQGAVAQDVVLNKRRKNLSPSHPLRVRNEGVAAMNRIVVVGASQGGAAALRTIVEGLPADFAAPVLVVQHVGPSSLLPSLLNDVGRMPAKHADDGDAIVAGRILVAPPEHHMLVIDGHVALTRGPRENWSRPALDPLFRSAAAAFREAVIGVVLTGRLTDGTSGLFEIKRLGGVAIVQEPADCEAPAMPQSAIAHVAVDHRLPAARIAGCLLNLVNGAAARDAWSAAAEPENRADRL